ncbi:hypothetical protein KBY24_01275 [Ruegeria pomeroyi]|uniref:Uncharacterized protein n=1 Tax=Ruegeria alba TaxID=2916756 RepID=A0ABS9NQY9_9RHOB|nr:hypothetical protein [Ruegeria alba]MCE8511194.1 hypothetical protein [Ruegeria pomeroyi]MCE8519594.1 hypothetical protein [Ruegeria pomeroyi]MCE8528166.1 hypothetical protein [Ruegeria pomeroyi]MCE8532002.1 hypothetical protein [Ruegeria pomeroyi]MCE8545915.1 hypothetical protein [Ruegeria pomeroyi]
MKLSEYASYDATGLAELVARKEVSADELTDAARYCRREPAAEFHGGCHRAAHCR